jgi:hypothetical protein
MSAKVIQNTLTRVGRYCLAVIYRDDAVEIDLQATDALTALDEIHQTLHALTRADWTDIVLICEPTS